MPPITIRPMRAEDLKAVVAMIEGLADHHGDQARIDTDTLKRDALEDPRWIAVLVAEHAGKSVGYAALNPLTQLQYGVRGMDMHHLFVVAPERGKGIGRALIEACIAHAKEQGCRFVVVGTNNDNVKAQAVYRQLGFDDLQPGPRLRIKW